MADKAALEKEMKKVPEAKSQAERPREKLCRSEAIGVRSKREEVRIKPTTVGAGAFAPALALSSAGRAHNWLYEPRPFYARKRVSLEENPAGGRLWNWSSASRDWAFAPHGPFSRSSSGRC